MGCGAIRQRSGCNLRYAERRGSLNAVARRGKRVSPPDTCDVIFVERKLRGAERMFENRKDTLKFVGELAIVFLPAFIEELDRNGHRASPVHAALAALLVALPLALCAHLSKNKWNRPDWK